MVSAIIFFLINFHKQNISNDIAVWAQFGDYFSGVLNPILAIINICVFVMLTLTIQKITDENNNTNLETSKKIALMSLKHEELKHFKEVMDKNLLHWSENPKHIDSIKKVLYGYNVLEYRILFLFPELRDSSKNAKLRELLVESLNFYQKGDSEIGFTYHIPLSNFYSMLVSEMGKWTIS
ncbi:hypothetical protein [Emticicia sp.]|uniref:hypothetical protein n=1 Tax=Emticicia sp. TaxID=1930953 RepID=UPI003750F5E1